ncbi:MAG: GNAT family N-acetyltransferase [Gemmatimonadaceae bacterium]|nr:GNAT family N-acetyltransferase [Gemmatimonadaceae bacterium]
MATIDVESPASASSIADVTAGLRSFNVRHMEPVDPAPFNVVLRDDNGTIVGGCLCETRWTWVFVDVLWVHEAHRGAGYGTALLAAAEDEARRRGCTKAHLDTISFQARPFYEKLGWRLFGTLEDYPPGHTRYYLRKDLSQTS